MSVAKVLELSSESPESFDHAMREGLKRASKTIQGIRSVWVKNQEALVEDGEIRSYRVMMKVTFELQE